MTPSIDAILFRLSTLLVALLSICLLTTTAGTNICVFLLLLLTPWAWKNHQWSEHEYEFVKPLFAIIILFCLFDLVRNIIAGYSFSDSFNATRHVRKFFFIILLWPIFAIPKISRSCLISLGASVLTLSIANLIWTLYLNHDEYMLYSMPNMHGQIIVGMILLTLHAIFYKRMNLFFLTLTVSILFCSLFYASTRRTGYIILFCGFIFLCFLIFYDNKELKYRRELIFLGLLILFTIIFFVSFSSKFQVRMTAMINEYYQFINLNAEDRSQIATSTGLRLQYFLSSLMIIRENLFFGVGSLEFKSLFWEVNKKLGALNPVNYAPNPHNEYLYILATKGLIGLGLYLGIFYQGCRVAMSRNDLLQKHGFWIFVLLFLFSILFNSMSIDMIEGHFMMLVFLCFLAPKSVWYTSE